MTSNPVKEEAVTLEMIEAGLQQTWREHANERDGLCNIYLAMRQADPRTAELEAALRKAREAIASLDDDTLGVVRQHPSGDLDNGYAYPIRDDLLAEIDAALNRKEG